MKRIIFIILIIISVGCSNYKRGEIVTGEKYRKESQWDGKIIYNNANTFENRYKYSFNNRYLDDYYLLCYFLSYTEVTDTNVLLRLNYKYILDEYKNAKVILLKINTIQTYHTMQSGNFYNIFEELIREKNDIVLQRFLKGEFKENSKYLYLLVSDEEIEKINSSIKNMSLNLSQYDDLWDYGFHSNDTAKSMINFYYGEYDLSKLFPYEYFLRHYDSISNSLRNK